jgi:hypothetical protein
MLTLAKTQEYQEVFRIESQPCCLLGNINASRPGILSHGPHEGALATIGRAHDESFEVCRVRANFEKITKPAARVSRQSFAAIYSQNHALNSFFSCNCQILREILANLDFLVQGSTIEVDRQSKQQIEEHVRSLCLSDEQHSLEHGNGTGGSREKMIEKLDKVVLNSKLLLQYFRLGS